MKLYKFMKKSFCLLMAATLTSASIISAQAADTKTYKFSDISTQVDIPTDLVVFTRNVTSADPNLSLISASADQLRFMFEQSGTYLEAFPKDVSYEVVLSGKPAQESFVNFDTLNTAQLEKGLEEYKTLCKTVDTDEVFDASIYTNGTAPYYIVNLKSISNGITVYIKKYYTIMEGKEIAFTLQSNGEKLNDEKDTLLKNIVDSAKYMEIKPSFVESPIFTELFGYMVGIGITVGALGLILLVISKSTRKKKKKS